MQPEGEPAVRVLSILDEEPVRVAGGELDWVPLRRLLGVSAFGVNAYRAARAGEVVIEEHVESPGQEELYVVISGRARILVGEESFDCPAGNVVFVARPELSRSGVALEDGTVVLAVGGWPGKPYHPLPWEPIYLAQEAMRSGDWAAAAETLEREAGEQREHPAIRYRLACCLAQAGNATRALEELRAAIAARPEIRARAAGDEQLAALRDEAEWRELVG